MLGVKEKTASIEMIDQVNAYLARMTLNDALILPAVCLAQQTFAISEERRQARPGVGLKKQERSAAKIIFKTKGRLRLNLSATTTTPADPSRGFSLQQFKITRKFRKKNVSLDAVESARWRHSPKCFADGEKRRIQQLCGCIPIPSRR
jgi:hypothetical protein